MTDLASRLANLSPETRAVLARRLQQTTTPQRAGAEPLAIIGIGCRLPGGADSPESFWELLADGVDAISEVPRDRWNIDDYYDPDPSSAGKMATRWGGFIDGIDRFDAAFFGISPREAAQMDPQQRLLLEVAWLALEHAGQAPDRLAGSRTGVFVGVHSHSNDYCWLQYAQPHAMDAFSGTGSAHNFLSGRLSYLLDLQGPSIVLDTACSSSLVATHLACQSLRTGESSMAIVGGINLMLTPHFSVAASRMHMLASDGRCKTFEASADGFTRGEGCGVVVIKRLADAVTAGDRVLAVIRGSAINQDGHTNGITAPNGLSQQTVIREALKNAGVDPAQVGYVEAHGTGTPLGDPIEVEALAAVLADERQGHVVALGSAKSNIGHLEGAAGVAGLIKAVLTLQHRRIPPVVHFRELNPHISLNNTPFVIPTSLTQWEGTGAPRIAGVSSFGWSGTNAHVVLQEALVAEPAPKPVDGRLRLLPVSARTPAALEALAGAWHIWCAGREQRSLHAADVCASAAVRRAHHECRAAFVGATVPDFEEALLAMVRGESHPRVTIGRQGERGGIVFVFPGQGSQWIGMGRQLFASEPVFREAIEQCGAAVSRYVNWSLVEQLHAEPQQSRLQEIDVIQPTLFSIELALAALWRSWGIQPDAVVGHSMGEVAAACVAGALTLDDAARIICLRSQLLRRISGRGAMTAVELSLEQTAQAIAGYESRLSIAVSNSPSSTVISGDVDAVEEVMAALQQRDVFCRAIKVDVASHSPQVDVLREDLLRALDGIRPRASAVPMYSTVTAAIATGEDLNPEYWTRNLRQPVLLSHAMERLTADGNTTFVEMSPHPILLPAIEGGIAASQREGLVLPSLRRDEDERAVMLSSASRMYVAGYDIDWVAVNGPGGFAELPRYQYQRERFWLDVDWARSGAAVLPGVADADAHPILGAPVDLAERPGARIWQCAVDPVRFRYLLDHRLDGAPLLPGSVLLELALAAAGSAFGDMPVAIRNFELVAPLVVSAEGPRQVLQVSAMPAGDDVDFRIFSIEANTPRLLARAALSRLDVSDPEPSGRAPVRAGGIAADLFYERLERRGISIGPALRTVEEVSQDASGVTGRVALPESAARDVARYRCHPALSDGLLQLTAVAAGDDARVYVPARIREVRWYRHPELRLTGTVERVMAPDGGADVELGLRLSDERGSVLELVGMELRALEGDRRTRIPERVEDWLYQVQWIDKPIDEQRTVKHPSKQERWIVFADRGGIGAGVAEWLGRKGQHAAVVTVGEAFAEHGSDRFSARVDQPADVERVLEAVLGHERPSCRGMVFLWPLDASATPADASSFERALDLGTTAALRLVQSLASRDWSQTPGLWLVTRGAQPAAGEAVSPWQAPLWGLGRVVAEEHHELFGGLIDLDPDGDRAAAIADVSRAIWEADGEPEVAWRAGHRRVPRLTRRRGAAVRHVQFRTDATYAITGAFGGVGLEVARWMVREGARRLMLLGRTVLPPRDQWASVDPSSPQGRRAAAIRELEAAGASVHVAAVDIADAGAVASYMDVFEREGWPAVRGLIHCAAVIDAALLDRADADAFAAAFRAKAIGAVVLHERLSSLPLDFFVMFSSIAALLPQPGQASYAAANAFLDAFASWQRGRGRPALSIEWGVWRGLGESAGRARRGVEDFERSGIAAFAPEDGLRALGRLLAQDATCAAVMPVDWAQYRQTRGAARTPLVSTLAEEPLPDAPEGAPVVSFRQTLASAPPEERRPILEHHLQELLARVLRLPLNRVDPVTPLGSLGLESLMTLELRNRLQATLGVKLSATLVWNHPTVRALATHLARLLDIALDETAAPLGVAPETSTPPTLAVAVADLSEEDALRALMGGAD